MAEETQAGWSHQQSASGLLPEGLEDPAEVSRPVHRWIRVTFFYHERGSISQLKLDSGLPVRMDACLTLCYLCR